MWHSASAASASYAFRADILPIVDDYSCLSLQGCMQSTGQKKLAGRDLAYSSAASTQPNVGGGGFLTDLKPVYSEK